MDWTLNTPDEYKNEMYFLSKAEPYGLDYNQLPSPSGKRPIPLTTVLTRIPSQQEIVSPFNESDSDGVQKGFMLRSDSDLKQDKSMESVTSGTSLDEDVMRGRNVKYAKLFVAHLRSVVMKRIAERLVDKEIPNLLSQYPIDSQNDLDLLQEKITKHY